MTMYRFVTDNRAGKWYADLRTAQQQACAIGAGFLESRSGMFYQYAGTRLEVLGDDVLASPAQPMHDMAA